MRQRTGHGSVVVVLPVVVAAVLVVASGVGSGACGAALVDIDAGSDARDDAGEDAGGLDEVTPPDADCGTPWYFDGDGDTWGDPDATVCVWTQPSGHVARPGDCCDANGDVHPEQTGWFAAAYEQCGAASFDYDCDGEVQNERPDSDPSPTCSLDGLECRFTREGWQGGSAPSCGADGTWVSGCGIAPTCLPQTDLRTQACR